MQAIHQETMGKRSTKQLAYLSEHLGKFKPSADITSPFSQLDADALLSLIPLSLIMNSPRVRVEASRQRCELVSFCIFDLVFTPHSTLRLQMVVL